MIFDSYPLWTDKGIDNEARKRLAQRKLEYAIQDRTRELEREEFERKYGDK